MKLGGRGGLGGGRPPAEGKGGRDRIVLLMISGPPFNPPVPFVGGLNFREGESTDRERRAQPSTKTDRALSRALSETESARDKVQSALVIDYARRIPAAE